MIDVDPAGWLSGTLRIASPNWDDRPASTPIELVVVHAISLPPEQFGGPSISALFTNALDPDVDDYFTSITPLRVSTHLLIRRDGLLIQYVPCEKRAWHAGVSIWRGRERCNDFSIGIELEGCDATAFEMPQYMRLRSVLAALRGRYPVVDVGGHSDIAPGRKTDPGPHFDWLRLS